eukprot:5910292-Pleurochrysis_carterae.AAC.1
MHQIPPPLRPPSLSLLLPFACAAREGRGSRVGAVGVGVRGRRRCDGAAGDGAIQPLSAERVYLDRRKRCEQEGGGEDVGWKSGWDFCKEGVTIAPPSRAMRVRAMRVRAMR